MTIKKAIFGLVAGILVSASAFAENIAVVDIQKIAAAIPQTAAMQQSLQAEFAAQTEEIKKLESDIKFNVEKFQRESMTMSDEQKAELQTKVQQLQQAFQAKAQPLEQQMRRRQAEERNKIFALIQQAISTVATNEKIDVVLDAQAVRYVTKGEDITDKVAEKVKKLN